MRPFQLTAAVMAESKMHSLSLGFCWFMCFTYCRFCDPALCDEIAFETPHTPEDALHWRSLEAAWVQLGSHGWTRKEGFEIRCRP